MMTADDLSARLDHWVSAGLITAGQADLIRADVAAQAGLDQRSASRDDSPDDGRAQPIGQADETGEAPGVSGEPGSGPAADGADDEWAAGGAAGRPAAGESGPAAGVAERESAAAEAMAYFGMVIALIAAGSVTLGVGASARPALAITLSSVFTVALWAGAAMLPDRFGPSARRVRAVMLLTSAATYAAALSLSLHLGAGWAGKSLGLAVSGGTLLVSVVLWRLHSTLPQQAVVLLAGLVTAGVATAFLPSPSVTQAGLAVWAAAVAWFALAWGGIIRPARGGMVLSAIAALAGAQVVMWSNGSTLLAVCTVAVLLALSVAFHDEALLLIAALGSLGLVPLSAAIYSRHALASSLTLFAVGVLLVVAAVVAINRGRAWPTSRPSRPVTPDWRTGRPAPALLVASLAAAGTTAVILGLGL